MAERPDSGEPGMMRSASSGMADGILHRATGLVALALLAAGLTLSFVELPGASTCGMKLSTGLPCPGCGMTRSVQHSFRGDLILAWQYHPFGPLFVAATAMVGALALLPGHRRRRLARRLGRYDPVLFVAVLALLSGMIIYGGFRAVMVLAGSERHEWWRAMEERPPALVERERGE